MPASEDTSLEVATQIRNMLRAQNELYMAQARLMRGQLAMMEAMAEASREIDVDRLHAGFENAERQIAAAEAAMQQFQTTGQGALGAVAGGAGTTADAIDSLGDSFITAGNNMQRLGLGGVIFEGMKKGLDVVTGALHGFAGIMETVFTGLKDLGITVFAALLSPFEALFKQAAQPVNNTAYRQAVEDLRGTFGSLAKNEGAAVMQMFKNLGRELGETGLRTRRVLGPPAEQLKYMTALAKGFGAQFNMVFNQGLIENAGNVVAFKKALDMSDESMKTTARIAATTGRTIDEVLREQANYAIQLGDAFGISSMELSRDMQQMENDMQHFGGMSKKALAETAVYAKKLGIEVKTLSGIMDAFDNFDSAADAAARLNQQFGIQIDTMEMLREEDPAKRADMLRSSLNAAGISYTDLDRRSKSYLASQLKISEAEAELLFNRNNQGLSLDQIKKKAGEAEKKQLTQAEAMEKLADSIQLIVQQMQQMEEGLFANFFKGFNQGVANGREMRKLLNEISQVMLIALQAGRRLGRAFTELFPGIGDIIKGFQELFDPTRWRRTFGDIVDAFRNFFTTIESDPTAGMKALFKRLQEIFFGHFDSSTAGGQKLIQGFKKFFTSLIQVAAAAIRVVVPEILHALRDGLKYLNDVLNGRAQGVGIDLTGLWNDLSAAFGDLFNELFLFFDNFFEEYGDDIWNSFKNLASSIWTKLAPWLEEHWTEIVFGLAAVFVGPSLIGALASGLGAMFTSVIGDVFSGGLGGLLGGTGAAGAAAGAAGGADTAAAGAAGIREASDAVNEAAGGGFEQLLTNVATILTANSALSSLMEGLYEFAKKVQDNNISAGSIAIAVGALTAAGAMLYGFMELAKVANAIPGGATAVAGLVALIAAFISQQVAQKFTEFLKPLIGDNGLFAQLYKLITSLGGAGLKPEVAEQTQNHLSIGLLFLAGIVKVLSDLIPLYVQLAPLVGEASSIDFTKVGNVVQQLMEKIVWTARSVEEKTRIFSKAQNLDARFILIGGFVVLLQKTLGDLLPALQNIINSFTENKIDMSVASNFMQTMMEGITDFIVNMINATESIPIERFQAIANMLPLLTGIGDYIKAFEKVGDVFKTSTEGNAGIDTAAVDAILGSLVTVVSRIMWSSKAFENFNAEQIRAISSVVGNSVSLIKNFGEISKNMSNLGNFDTKGLEDLNAFVPFFSNTLLTLTSMSDVFNQENMQKLDLFNGVAERIVGTAENLANINQALIPVTSNTTENLRARVGELLGTIGDTVNAVNSIGSVGLSTTLEALENNLGLGRSASYTIKNENFNLTINMKVVIDAGRFENVFYRRAMEEEGGADTGVFLKTAFNQQRGQERTGIPVRSGE